MVLIKHDTSYIRFESGDCLDMIRVKWRLKKEKITNSNKKNYKFSLGCVVLCVACVCVCVLYCV